MYSSVAESTYRPPFGYQPSAPTDWSSVGHGALDVAGLLPILGIVPDAINAGWYGLEYAVSGDPKDRTNMLWSTAAMVPGIGLGATISKSAGKIPDAINLFRGVAYKHGASGIDEVHDAITGKSNIVGRIMNDTGNAWGSTNPIKAEQYARQRWMFPVAGTHTGMRDLRPVVQHFQVPKDYLLKHADFGDTKQLLHSSVVDNAVRLKGGIPKDFLKGTVEYHPNLGKSGPFNIQRPATGVDIPDLLKSGDMFVNNPEEYLKMLEYAKGDDFSKILNLIGGKYGL